jgi:hypothetical protein
MEKQGSILDTVKFPTRIIVQRIALTPAGLGALAQDGELAAEGGVTCELEAGGQVIARGKIVRRRGGYFFKVRETGEEETT